MNTPVMQQSQKNLGHFPVSLPHNHDNGLGFGQGSTSGVYNQYYRGGFHRGVPLEADMNVRRWFNNGVTCDSYSCHYNPETLNDKRYHESVEYTCTPRPSQGTPELLDSAHSADKKIYEDNNLLQSVGISHDASLLNGQINNVFIIIIAIIVFFFLFGGYIF